VNFCYVTFVFYYAKIISIISYLWSNMLVHYNLDNLDNLVTGVYLWRALSFPYKEILRKNIKKNYSRKNFLIKNFEKLFSPPEVIYNIYIYINIYLYLFLL